MSRYSLEIHMRIYNDDTGDYYEIRPDPDGLDLVELAAVDGHAGTKTSFTMPLEAARLFSRALTEYIIRESGRLIQEQRERSGDAAQDQG